eukprot:363429-Chlamydomonas_euryale.AAC.27
MPPGLPSSADPAGAAAGAAAVAGAAVARGYVADGRPADSVPPHAASLRKRAALPGLKRRARGGRRVEEGFFLVLRAPPGALRLMYAWAGRPHAKTHCMTRHTVQMQRATRYTPAAPCKGMTRIECGTLVRERALRTLWPSAWLHGAGGRSIDNPPFAFAPSDALQL